MNRCHVLQKYDGDKHTVRCVLDAGHEFPWHWDGTDFQWPVRYATVIGREAG